MKDNLLKRSNCDFRSVKTKEVVAQRLVSKPIHCYYSHLFRVI